MTAVEILLKIKSVFEGKGAEDARTKTEDLGKAGEKAGEEASGGLEKVEDAADKAAPAVSSVGAAAQKMGGDTAAASMLSAGNIGKITGAVTALAAIYKMVSEAVVEMHHRMDGIKMDNLVAGIDSSKEAMQRLNRAYEAAEATRSMLYAAQLQGIDLLKQEELASMELAKARELAAAKDDDERRRIELRYAEMSQNTSADRDVDASRKRAEALRAERAATEAKVADMEEIRDTQLAEATHANKEAMRLYQSAAEKGGSYWANTPIGRINGVAKDADMTRAEADKMSAARDRATADWTKTGDEIEALNRRLAEIELELRKEESAQVVTRTRQEAASITSATASRELESSISERKQHEANQAAKAEVQTQIDAKKDEYEAAKERYSSELSAARNFAAVQSREAKDSAKVYDSMRRKGSGEGYLPEVQRQMREADEAEQKVLELSRQMTSKLSSIKREIDALQQTMGRMPN